MKRTVYRIIAYPQGARTEVAKLYGASDYDNFLLEGAARRAGVSVGSEADSMIAHAQVHARLRGEYVDVERDRFGMAIGQQIAVVGPEGPIS